MKGSISIIMKKKEVFYEGIFQRMELKYMTLGGKR